MNVKKLTTLAMLTAISMIVFLIEAQIPLPFAVPGDCYDSIPVRRRAADVRVFCLFHRYFRRASAENPP